jgi:acyl carrier protein
MTVDEFREILARILRIKEVTLQEGMKTTRGWDSLRHIQLVLELERYSGVEIPPEVFGSLDSAQALMKFLQEHDALTVG